jgi:hypothetical protein
MAPTSNFVAVLLFGSALVLSACEGPAGNDGRGINGSNGNDGQNGQDGTNGSDGTNGTDGTDGTDGNNGTDGTDGDNGGNVEVGLFHGRQAVLDEAYEESGTFPAVATITSAKADGAGKVTVDFSVTDEEGTPLVGVAGVTASIAKLVPPNLPKQTYNQWIPYIYRAQTVSNSASGDWPNPDGTAADQGYRENDGTLTDNGDGSYTYVYSTNLTAVTTPVSGTAIDYEQGLRHRVSIMIGGGTGATADASFDFVPDGTSLDNTESRDIIRTDTCRNCHGPDFEAHGGDRRSVENCVTCHGPGSVDPHSGESLDFKVMIHKIHAGGELATIPGADGIVWDDPATPADESADNGSYAIWGFQNNKAEWWKSAFPSVLANCQKCHEGAGAEVDAWKTTPSRDACGSCHNDVDFVTGTNHTGGAQDSDENCTVCHKATGQAVGKSVEEGHDWTVTDDRNLPELAVTLTVSTPANGTHFVPGESPVVTIVLNDLENGNALLDHSNITAESSGTAEGCVSAALAPQRTACSRRPACSCTGRVATGTPSSPPARAPRSRRPPADRSTSAARARRSTSSSTAARTSTSRRTAAPCSPAP